MGEILGLLFSNPNLDVCLVAGGPDFLLAMLNRGIGYERKISFRAAKESAWDLVGHQARIMAKKLGLEKSELVKGENMDDLLELLLANPGVSVRFDTFTQAGTLRLKFLFDGKSAEEFIKLPAKSDPDGGFVLRQAIMETVQNIRARWKLAK